MTEPDHVARPRLGEFADGRLVGARWLASPNCDARPPGATISLIVIHAISLPPGEFGGDGIERLFTNRIDVCAHPYYRELEALRVSAHFLIDRQGGLTQFVACTQRAWHAGVSSWRGRQACNDFSIGIELEGCDGRPFEEPQYMLLETLLRSLRGIYPSVEVVGHSAIAPGRKTDPGPNFDWARVRSA